MKELIIKITYDKGLATFIVIMNGVEQSRASQAATEQDMDTFKEELITGMLRQGDNA